MIEKRFPQDKVAYTYNNVVKIGKSSGIGFPGEIVYKSEMDNFNVLKMEIEILKPDLLLFFSGTSYDVRIRQKLGEYIAEPIKSFSENELCRLKFANDLPFAVRTFHPKAMYIKKLDKLHYFNSIIDAAF